MGKRKRGADAAATSVPTAGSYQTVFVDTNLQTHLAMLVSDSDTVSDLKKKVRSEHLQCFPNCGKIKINALKVMRNGFFYHLSDSMLVKNGFAGVKKSWFLSVDASSLTNHNKNQINKNTENLGSTDQLALRCPSKTHSGDSSNRRANISTKETMTTNDHCSPGDSCREVQKDLVVDAKHGAADHYNQLVFGSNLALEYTGEKGGLPSEINIVSETNANHRVDDSEVRVNYQYDNLPEGTLRSGSDVNKKHRFENTENLASNCTVEYDNVHIDGLRGQSSGKTVGAVPNDVEMENIDAGKEPCSTPFDDTSLRPKTREYLGKHFEARNDKSRNMVFVMQNEASLGEDSEALPAAKKRKTRECKRAGNPQEEENTRTSMENSIIPENFVFGKQKNITASREKLLIATPDDAHMITDTSCGKKKKKKVKRLKDEEVIVDPLSQNVGEEKHLEDLEIEAINLGDENAETVGYGIANTSDAAIPPGVSQNQSNTEPVQVLEEDNQPSTMTVDLIEQNTKVEGKSGLKGTNKSKRRRSNKVKEIPRPVVTELDNLNEDALLSGSQDIVHNDQTGKTSEPDNVEELLESPQFYGKEELVSEKSEQLIQDRVDNQFKEAVSLANFSETTLGEASEASPAANKRKTRERKRAGNPQEEENTRTSMENSIIPENPVFEKQKNITVSREKLLTATSDDAHMITGTSGGKKKKVKRLKDQEVIVDPYSQDVGEEKRKEDVEIEAITLDNEIAETVASGIANTSDAAIPPGVSQNRSNTEPVQVLEGDKQPSTMNVIEHDAKVENKSAASKLGPETGLKRTKKSKQSRFNKVKELPLPAVTELDSLKEDDVLSGSQDIVSNNQTGKTSEPDNVEELLESPQFGEKEIVSEKSKQLIQDRVDNQSREAAGSANISETNIIMEHGKCSDDLQDLESGVKGTKKSRKSRSANVKSLPPPGITDLGESKEDGCIICDDKVKNSSPDKVKDQWRSPQNCGTEEILPEKCEQPIQGGLDIKSKEVVDSGNLLMNNIIMEPEKSVGSKRIKKRAKKPVSTKEMLSNIEYSDNSATGLSTIEPHDRVRVEGKKEQISLSQTNSTESLDRNFLNTSLVGADVGGVRLRSDEELLPLSQINKTQGNEESLKENMGIEAKADPLVKEKENKMDSFQQNMIPTTPKSRKVSSANPRKKSKKDQNSSAKTPSSASPVKKQKVGVEELASLNDRHNEVRNASRSGRNSKSGNLSSQGQLLGKEVEPGIVIGIQNDSQSLTADSARDLSSDTSKRTSTERPPEHCVDGNVLNDGKANDGNHQGEGSKGTDDKVNFKDYFVAGKSKQKAPPVELPESKSSDVGVKSNMSAKVPIDQGKGRKLLTVKQLKDAARSRSSLSSEKESERKSSFDNRHSTVSKSSNKKRRKLVRCSPREKSLLATPASIFWDYSSESSGDESSDDDKGAVNSVSSKKTPDDSSSSDDSEGEGMTSLDSAENGAGGAKGANIGRNKSEIKTPHSKNITMDVIFRNSSRFKKAKLSAVQSQLEDTESQPIDFVPDSQPIH